MTTFYETIIDYIIHYFENERNCVMQTFYPWGKEILGFQLEENVLEQINELPVPCQTYYLGVEKKRNGSIDRDDRSFELREEILNKLDQICEQLKNQDPMVSVVLEQALMKQSFIAALIAHTLGFEYRVQRILSIDGRCEVRGMARDRAGHKTESVGVSEFHSSDDSSQNQMGAFYAASKKAFISAVSTLSELDLSPKLNEVLIS